MSQPITVSDVKTFMRLEYAEDDEVIEGLIETAKESVESYLRHEIDLNNCPARVRQAMLYTVGWFYENRENAGESDLPPVAVALLRNLRTVRW